MRFICFTLLIVNVCFAIYVYRVVALEPVVVSVGEPALGLRSSDSLILLNEIEKKPIVETVRLRESANVASQSSGSLSESSEGVAISASQSSEATNMCMRVGAFSSMADANDFVEKLSEGGVKSTVKNVLVSTTVGFWLHLPPLPSSKELRRRLAELQRQGVDSYAIPDGELANGVSLGMFSEQQRAESLQKSISQLGYRPKIAEVPREKRELWVFLLKGEEQKVSDEMWFKWLSVNNLPKKQEILCSDVASA
ncbi:hypothetical protein IMCC1989_2387 [gamma proteobacterium IMCC1989]|nr:hypothetical protein IMCC1989_2387 [gamma proteobacterium IMCC1989]